MELFERLGKSRALWGRIAVVFAVGVTGFLVTAVVRSNGADDTAEPASTTASPTSTTTRVGTEVARPAVVEVPMRVLAPIETAELPDAGSYEGLQVQTSVTDILSPVVGIAMVPSAGGSTAASWSPPPPEFADELGLSALPNDTSTVDGSDDDQPEPVVISEASIDQVVRRAAEQASSPELGSPELGSTESGSTARRDVDPVVGEPVVLSDGDAGFVDPCADADEDVCPDPGEPGTVTATFALDVPPPLSIVVTANPTGECAADVGDDELRVAIESTTPIADMTFRYVYVNRQGVPLDVPVVTPEATAATWLDAFAAAASDAPPPPAIQHCVTLTDIETRGGVGYFYRVTAEDVFGQVYRQSGRELRFLNGALQIPSTRIWPLTDNEVLVSVPHRRDQGVRVRAYRRIDRAATGDPCETGRAPGYQQQPIANERTRSETAARALSAAGLSPLYVYRTTQPMRLEEGSTYRICIAWLVGGASFEAGVERAQSYELTTPDTLDTSFTVVDIDIDGDDPAALDPGDLVISVRPKSRALVAGFGPCGSWRNETRIDESVSIDGLICDIQPRATALYGSGAVLEITARDLEGTSHSSRQVIGLRSCAGVCVPPSSDLFRVELPTGAPERDFWCGLFGDACERPSDRSYGTVLIRVDYSNTRGSSNSGWSVSEPTEIVRERPDPPSTPQLDITQTPLSSGPSRSQTVTIPVVADRPVNVTAELRAPDGGVPCVHEGGTATTASSRVATSNHTFTFTRLCPFQGLFVVLTLTDESGNTSVWHGVPGVSGFPADAQLWRRGFVPHRLAEWQFDADLEVTIPTFGYRLRGLGASLNGSDATGGTWHPNGPSSNPIGCNVPTGPIVTRRLPTGSRGVSGNEVTFTIVVDIALFEPGCVEPSSDDFEQLDPQVLQLTLPIEEVEVGESYVLAASIPVPGLDDPDATLDIRGTITIVGAA